MAPDTWGQPEHEPGVVLLSGRVVTRGTGRYHDEKRQIGQP